MSDQQAIHWLAVGKVSNAARSEVERTGGRVVDVGGDPSAVLVGIAHKGKHDLALTNASEIEIEVLSTELHLVWLSSDAITNAAFISLTETSLITYQEYEEVLTGRNEAIEELHASGISFEEELGDLEDHPF